MTAEQKEGHKRYICSHIAEAKSLASYCRNTQLGYSTVTDWLRDDQEFAANYTCAREAAGDADADTVTDIRERLIAGEIAPDVARVAIDAAKWSAGVRKPKKYGPKLDIEAAISGAITVTIGGDA